MGQTWQPLLQGSLADDAWQAIDGIARDIPSPDDNQAIDDGAGSSHWALAGGAAGLAVFYAYLARSRGDSRHSDLACEHLQVALEGASGRLQHMGLWDGLAGVSWVFDHLAGRLFELDEDDVETSDGDHLLTTLLQTPQFANYDLIQGLAGFGVACLEGLPRAGARRSLDAVLNHLLRSYETLDDGIAWFTPPSLLPNWQRETAPDGYYNLGVAHGMPAVVTLLARCIQAAIRPDELLPVLDGLVRWILAQRGADGFPSWVPKGRDVQRRSRLAWCYGDLGIAAALLAAGVATSRSGWQAAAADIACRAAAREPEESGVKDAGICHGAAGVAHLFHRLYRGSGRPELAEAARTWCRRTLDMQRSDCGIGGFPAWTLPRGQRISGELQWVDDPGLLTGAAGVGLCLLAAVSDHEPSWDRSLLVSAPVAEQVVLAA